MDLYSPRTAYKVKSMVASSRDATVSLEILPGGPDRKYALVRLGGRLDAHSADAARPELQALVGATPLVIVGDLTDLSYISSAGLNLLILICREARKVGGDLRLASIQPYVREILDLTGATKIFKLYDTVDEAVARLV